MAGRYLLNYHYHRKHCTIPLLSVLETHAPRKAETTQQPAAREW